MASVVFAHLPDTLEQAGDVFTELVSEWDDLKILQKTLQGDETRLFSALSSNHSDIVLASVANLASSLPDDIKIAAVCKRLEPRFALIAKGQKDLTALPQDARVGVLQARDAAFLKIARADLKPSLLSGTSHQQLDQLGTEVDALILPYAHLRRPEQRKKIDATLDVNVMTPAVGQGALALLTRADDDMAQEVAYSLQHRPSFDRVRAERSFLGHVASLEHHAVGAYASVTADGELSLFGALVNEQTAFALQAEISGEASEALSLGKELAEDMLEQLKKHG